jgi:hypothetical protein
LFPKDDVDLVDKTEFEEEEDGVETTITLDVSDIRNNKNTINNNITKNKNRVIFSTQNNPGIHFFPIIYIIYSFYFSANQIE